MPTRFLRIWDGEETGGRVNVSAQPLAEYFGPYLERYETPRAAVKAECKGLRIGLIFDKVKGCAVCFRQGVASREDATPTDIVIDRSQRGFVLESWSTDPQLSDPPGRDAPCVVLDCTERAPTEDEKRIIAIANNPPSKANCLRWKEKQKAKERKAKAEEALIRLVERAATAPAPAAPAVSAAERDAAIARALEARTFQDAIAIYHSKLLELVSDQDVFSAGWMHTKKMSWADMMERLHCSKSTLSKRIKRFYKETGLRRENRRKGMGKKLPLDEARDGKYPQ